ncbi:glycosyltransferase family 4 protein [Candidatus Nomurabacteria bacterium]|nr:glycosyltransferase family 4 protein [Candidatus Nomurabacteria bacterium]
MSKILIDARDMRSSTGRYIRSLLMELERLDRTNQYVILGRRADVDARDQHSWRPKAPNFNLVVVDIPLNTFREQLLLAAEIRKHSPDLVHFWLPQQPLFLKHSRITTIHDLNYIHLHIHTNGILRYELKRLIFRGFLKHVVRSNKFILSPTNYTKQDIVDYTKLRNPEKIVVTPEGTAGELANVKPKHINQLNGKEFLLYVGQSSEYKGQLRLIEALQLLRKKLPRLELALIGKENDYTQKLKKIVAKQNYHGVRFLGFVDDRELRWAYENCACYVQPSIAEGFGLMNLEAMFLGAPVASSNATCLPEVSGSAANYFNPYDIGDMAQAIEQILSDPKLRKKLILEGKKQYKKFSWERMAEQTLAVYNKVLDEKN